MNIHWQMACNCNTISCVQCVVCVTFSRFHTLFSLVLVFNFSFVFVIVNKTCTFSLTTIFDFSLTGKTLLRVFWQTGSWNLWFILSCFTVLFEPSFLLHTRPQREQTQTPPTELQMQSYFIGLATLQMTLLFHDQFRCLPTLQKVLETLLSQWHFQQPRKWKTRMVRLPATTAIEYVAACWVSGAGGIFVREVFCTGDFFPGVFCPGALLAGGAFVRGVFCPGGLLSGGLMPIPPKFNVYTHRLGFLCLAS